MNPTTAYCSRQARAGFVVVSALFPLSYAIAAPARTFVCPFMDDRRLAFVLPENPTSLPDGIDFDDPVKATEFHFRDGVLSLKAVDESHPERVRIVLSARLDRETGAYIGKLFVDLGGHQLMFHNERVRCTVSSQ